MNFRILLLVIPLLIFGSATWVLVRMGIFKSVEIREEVIGPLHLVGVEHIGPYHEINSSIQEVEKWAHARSLDCHISYGQYLDNPEVVEADRLHSWGGCVLEQIPETLPAGFKAETLEAQKYLVGHFSGSPALGPWKVYSPVFQELARRHLKAPDIVTEIYTAEENGLKTQYLFKIEPTP